MGTWVDPQTWYAGLESYHAAAAGLITNAAGEVLLVKPNYRDHWAFPGGYVDAGEYPHEACARELREELGIVVQVGPLLVVDWAEPAGHRPRALVSLTFDCGVLPAAEDVRIDPDELGDWAFLPPTEAAARLPGNVAGRVEAALRARRSGPVYLPTDPG